MSYSPTERQGIYGVGLLISQQLGWILREQPTDDWGIDAQIEVVDESPTGCLIAAQIKSGQSWFSEEVEDGFIFRGSQRHLHYWRGHSLPVIIILYDTNLDSAYWQVVSDDFLEFTEKGWKILVPKSQQLSKSSTTELRRIALPDYLKRSKFDYLSSLLNGFATRSQTSLATPILYASLFVASRRICVLSPYLNLEFLHALTIASTSARVQLLGGYSLDTGIDIEKVRSDFPNFVFRSPDPQSPQIHAKVVVIDSNLAITSSASFISRGFGTSLEILIASTDPTDVNQTQKEFERIWDSFNSSPHG